ncbi:MAG: hypothetical protein AAFW00_21705 [Bacteroidota bacterium]
MKTSILLFPLLLMGLLTQAQDNFDRKAFVQVTAATLGYDSRGRYPDYGESSFLDWYVRTRLGYFAAPSLVAGVGYEWGRETGNSLNFPSPNRHSFFLFGQYYWHGLDRFVTQIEGTALAPTHVLPFVTLQGGLLNYTRLENTRLLPPLGQPLDPRYARISPQWVLSPSIGIDVGITENLNMTLMYDFRWMGGQPDSLGFMLIPQIGLTYGIGNRPERSRKIPTPPSDIAFSDIRLTLYYVYLQDPVFRDLESQTTHLFTEHTINFRLDVPLSTRFRAGVHGKWILNEWDQDLSGFYSLGLYTDLYLFKGVDIPFFDKIDPFIESGIYVTNYCLCDPGRPYRETGLNMSLGLGFDYPITPALGLRAGFFNYVPLLNDPVAYNFTQYMAGVSWTFREGLH